MWFRWMMVAFFFNGICTFGLRILAARQLAERYTSSYLSFWYLAGFVVLLVLFLHGKQRASRSDLLLGAGLGLCSAGGQTCLGLALAQGLPGNVVYPVTLAGGLFLVVAAGVLLFGERIGRAGIVGIVLGVISVILLALQ